MAKRPIQRHPLVYLIADSNIALHKAFLMVNRNRFRVMYTLADQPLEQQYLDDAVVIVVFCSTFGLHDQVPKKYRAKTLVLFKQLPSLLSRFQMYLTGFGSISLWPRSNREMNELISKNK